MLFDQQILFSKAIIYCSLCDSAFSEIELCWVCVKYYRHMKMSVQHNITFHQYNSLEVETKFHDKDVFTFISKIGV